MSRCIILGAGEVSPAEAARCQIREDDWVVAADGGYIRARELGLRPHLILGDFDSSPLPAKVGGVPVQTYSAHKDDTDAMLAARAGLERGLTQFILLGGLGGRLDHTLANIQLLVFLKDRGADGLLMDRGHNLRVLREEAWAVNKFEGYLSLLALGGDCQVSLSGVEYPLNHHRLTVGYPLGVSNRVTEAQARVEVHRGTLLAVEVFKGPAAEHK